MLRKLGPFFLVLLLSPGIAYAQDYVPPELEGWTEWVLKDTEYRSCPLYFNRGATGRGDFQCAWPGELRLDVGTEGASFTQEWTVYGEAQWLTLIMMVRRPRRVGRARSWICALRFGR